MLWWIYKSFVCSGVKHCAVPEEARALQLSGGRKTCWALTAALYCCKERRSWHVTGFLCGYSESKALSRPCLWHGTWISFGLLYWKYFSKTENLLSKTQGCWKAPLGPCSSLGISLTCPFCGESGAFAGGQTDAIKSKCQIPGGTACPGKGSWLGRVLLSLRAAFWLSKFSRHPAGIHRVCGGLTQTNLTSSM